MLKTAIYVLDNLLVFPDQMKRNLELTRGLNMAEAVMIELTRRGMNRQGAHAVMRRCSAASLQKSVPFVTVLNRERKVTRYVSAKELEKFVDPRRYLGSATKTVDRVVRELRPLVK